MAGGGGSIRKKLITRLLYTNEYIYYLCAVFLAGRADVSALFFEKKMEKNAAFWRTVTSYKMYGP